MGDSTEDIERIEEIKRNKVINDNVIAQQNLAGKDNRPQVSGMVDRFNKHLTNTEIAYINKIYHKDNNIKKKNIFEMELGEIMKNTTNFFNDFLSEYQNKIYDTELYYKDKNANNASLENIKIYIIAFVRYINESDNVIYLGIIMILISIILYFLNITTIKNNE